MDYVQKLNKIHALSPSKNKNPFFQCKQMKHFHQYLIQTPEDMFQLLFMKED